MKAAYDAASATMETQLLEAEQSKHNAMKHAKQIRIQSRGAIRKEYLEKRTEADKWYETDMQKAKAAYTGIVLAEQA